jgi:hypothetical protein
MAGSLPKTFILFNAVSHILQSLREIGFLQQRLSAFQRLVYQAMPRCSSAGATMDKTRSIPPWMENPLCKKHIFISVPPDFPFFRFFVVF